MTSEVSERPDAERRRFEWWRRYYRAILVAMVCIGALLRLVHLGEAAQWPLYSKHRLDALYYHQAARYIVERDVGLGRGPLHMSPLYTYLLAGTYAVSGVQPDVIRALQLLFGLLTILSVAALAKTLAGHRVALLAALLTATYRPLIFYETVLTPASLASLLLVSSIAAYYWLRRQPSAGRASIFALVFGLSILTRPNVLLFAPIAVAGIILDPAFGSLRGRRFRLSALMLGVLAASIAPVSIRNAVRGDSFVLITDAAGLNFYIGNRRGAPGYFEPVFGAGNAAAEFVAFRAEARRRSGRQLTFAEASRYFMREGLREIDRDKLGWLQLIGRKALFFAQSYEIPNTQNYQFAKELHPILRWPLPEFGWIFPFALLGCILAATRFRETYALLGAVFAYVAALLAFFVLAHYRLAVVPLLIVLAALGVVTLIRATLAARWRLVASGLAVVAVAGAVTFAGHPLLHRDFSQDYFQLAYAYHVRRQPAEAELYYRRALAIDPQNVSAHKNLARLAQSQGRRSVAVRHFRAILAIAERRHDKGLARYARANLIALGEPSDP
ncbi:MAG: glycosyltransferase family 39 protein [Myxococcales bacterium]|nr:glycosyltransferase family 39 protein [Myxococcales bacterium]